MTLSELLHRITPGRAAAVTVRAVWKGAVLAESDDTIVLEGNHYFPPESVDVARLQPSSRVTVCPWKGLARYYDVMVDGRRNEAAAWTYPHPTPAAGKIKERIAFWRGVEIVRV